MYASAVVGVAPSIVTVRERADPVLVNTRIRDPSTFLNAPVIKPEGDPDVVSLYAPGRINLDHMTNAQ
jgi:hypothetical protein